MTTKPENLDEILKHMENKYGDQVLIPDHHPKTFMYLFNASKKEIENAKSSE